MLPNFNFGYRYRPVRAFLKSSRPSDAGTAYMPSATHEASKSMHLDD
jgi:hypothetical protein